MPDNKPTHLSWKLSESNANGYSFEYPEKLETKYIYPNQWPPKLTVSEQGPSLDCPETPPESSLPERISQRTLNGRIFCIRATTGAAAGSAYTEYSYSAESGGRVVILRFTLQYPQCLNYDDPRKSECSKEREKFNPDALAAEIMDTLRQQ